MLCLLIRFVPASANWPLSQSSFSWGISSDSMLYLEVIWYCLKEYCTGTWFGTCWEKLSCPWDSSELFYVVLGGFLSVFSSWKFVASDNSGSDEVNCS